MCAAALDSLFDKMKLPIARSRNAQTGFIYLRRDLYLYTSACPFNPRTRRPDRADIPNSQGQ